MIESNCTVDSTRLMCAQEDVEGVSRSGARVDIFWKTLNRI